MSRVPYRSKEGLIAWTKFGAFVDDLIRIPQVCNLNESVRKWSVDSRKGIDFDDWVATHGSDARELMRIYGEYNGIPKAKIRELAEAEAPSIADDLADMLYRLAKVWPLNSSQVMNSLAGYSAITDDHKKELAAQYAAPQSRPYVGSWAPKEIEELASWVNYQSKKAFEKMKQDNGEQDRNITVIGQPKPASESLARERKLIRELGSITEETERNTRVARLIEARLKGER